jgi:hypothetical protein
VAAPTGVAPLRQVYRIVAAGMGMTAGRSTAAFVADDRVPSASTVRRELHDRLCFLAA